MSSNSESELFNLDRSGKLSKERMRSILDEMIAQGVLERDDSGDEPRYRLTDKGIELAREVITRHGGDPDDARSIEQLLSFDRHLPSQN